LKVKYREIIADFSKAGPNQGCLSAVPPHANDRDRESDAR